MVLKILNHKKKELLFFIILLLIIFYRSPHILLYGRFVAEEGYKFFANSYNHGFIFSLFYIDFVSGYFNLWSNISGIISNLFSLTIAPLVNVYLSLILYLFIFYIILFKNSYLIFQSKYKFIFCSLILLSPFNVPEIWLNSINSQIFLCIISFLIICEKNSQDNIEYSKLIILFIAGFSGIYTCALLPIFFYKYFKFKYIQDKYNFILIFICTCVQGFIIYFAKTANLLYEKKIHSVDLDLITNYLYNVPVKAFLGRNFSQYIFLNSGLSIKASAFLVFLFISIITTYLIYYFLKNKSLFNKHEFVFFSLIYSFISISIIVLIGGTGDYVGGRYAALPSFFLITLALFIIMITEKYQLKIIFSILIFTSIISGAYEFKNNNKYKKYLICIECPNWKQEVEKYNKDNSYYLKIWPYPDKTMKLN